MSKKKYDENDVGAAREYVEAMLGFILYSHKLHAQIRTMKEHGGEERHADGGRSRSLVVPLMYAILAGVLGHG